MKFMLITGPQAVGKMTVGEEVAKKTGLKLFHNHMTIELVSKFFSYGTDAGKRLVHSFRQQIFDEVIKSDLPGLIFTFVWAFNMQEDWDYVDALVKKFENAGAETYVVELQADVEERLRRNKTEHRLMEKPTKRNVEWSESELLRSMDKYRLNSLEKEIPYRNYLKIDNTHLSAEETAEKIVKHFGL
ncbi:MAG: AAA family ATPase [Clostridia bacterium]|nr:AAA family ATPase [Clostridia bacterium]